MSITVHPYKLTSRELEARVADASGLLPGCILKFGERNPAYGQVIEIQAETASPDGSLNVRIGLLHGQPGMGAQTAVLINDAQMAAEVQDLLPAAREPLPWHADWRPDLALLGPLTLLEGQDFVLKYRALELLLSAIAAYLPVLVIDPLGVFTQDERTRVYKAGEDLRLSVQAVGGNRFLSALGEFFPDTLRQTALAAVAEQLPHISEFIGFNRLMNLESAADMPLKNLILQNYYATAQARVFADQPEQGFDPARFSSSGVHVLDISGLAEPWKRLFYETLCTVLLRGEPEVAPVLIYPERYLDLAGHVLRHADESGLHWLILASADFPEHLRAQADNTLKAESPERLKVQGELTAGLPVFLNLEAEAPGEQGGSDTKQGHDADPANIHGAVAQDGFAEQGAPLEGDRKTSAFGDEAQDEMPGDAEAPSHPSKARNAAAPLDIVDLSAPRPEPGAPARNMPLQETEEKPADSSDRQTEDAASLNVDSSATAAAGNAERPAGEFFSTAAMGTNGVAGTGLARTGTDQAGAALTQTAVASAELTERMAVGAELIGISAYAGGVDYAGADEYDWEEAPSLEALYAGVPLTPSVPGPEIPEAVPQPKSSPVENVLNPPAEDTSDRFAQDTPGAHREESAQEPAIKVSRLENETVPEASILPLAEILAAPGHGQSAESGSESAPSLTTPEASARTDSSGKDEAAASTEAPTSPENSAFMEEREDFSFDVNLDQKPEEEWQLADGPVVSSRVQDSMREFEGGAWAAATGKEAHWPETGEVNTSDEENVLKELSESDASAVEEAAQPAPEGDHGSDQPVSVGSGPGTETESVTEPPVFEPSLSAPETERQPQPVDELPPIVEKQSEIPASGYQSGDRVRHETYGLGLVNKVIPMEEGNVILNITFESVGKRLLDPALCKLTREG